MYKLSRPQSGFGWIFGDVLPQALKLCFMPHEMIECVLLPEPTFAFDFLIDPVRREVLPRLALLQHGFRILKYREQMHMIR
ncbi:MAG: hypothetical protein RL693_1787, partial [Verrucomicrobiota bacterium]